MSLADKDGYLKPNLRELRQIRPVNFLSKGRHLVEKKSLSLLVLDSASRRRAIIVIMPSVVPCTQTNSTSARTRVGWIHYVPPVVLADSETHWQKGKVQTCSGTAIVAWSAPGFGVGLACSRNGTRFYPAGGTSCRPASFSWVGQLPLSAFLRSSLARHPGWGDRLRVERGMWAVVR